eukprot:6989602-Pyramimonas_sp.AAC.1
MWLPCRPDLRGWGRARANGSWGALRFVETRSGEGGHASRELNVCMRTGWLDGGSPRNYAGN